MSLFKSLWGMLILLFYCTLTIHGFDFDHRSKIVIDNDGGADDAMAIFIALLREKYYDGPEVIGITTVNGNVNESQAFINTQRVLNVADRLDVPLYRGNSKALVMGYPSDGFFGKDGLGDNEPEFYETVMAQPRHAALALIELSKKYKGKLIVVAMGPLTNIALAITLDPNFIQRLQQLYIGAGNIYSKEHPNPEFNAHQDVEAYYIVVQNSKPDKVTSVPFSQIQDTILIPKKWRINKLGLIKTKIMKAQNSYERISILKEDRWHFLDPAVMSLALDKEMIVSSGFSKQSITLSGQGRGLLTNDFTSKNANVNVIKAVSTSIYQHSQNGKLKLVIDNDAGGDDAMAIFVSLLYEKYYNGPKLVALTTANGNTMEDNVYKNNQKILNVASRQDVPIYRGSKSSLVHTPSTSAYYGFDGLGDTGEIIANFESVQDQHAVLRLIELSKLYEDKLVIVTIGTLTNVALAMKLDPQFLSRLSQLYVAAGHINSETFPMAEFNARMDAEAYHIVMQNATPDKVTIVPFSQTVIHLNFTKTWRKEVLGRIDSKIIRHQNKYEQVSLSHHVPGNIWPALDPAAVSIALRPDLVKEIKYSKNDIILCGDQRGVNTNEFVSKEDANVRVIFSYHTEKYRSYLVDLFEQGV
ncbi:hypothetical protein ACJJTC_006989 [Scirpophaga incertulas]